VSPAKQADLIINTMDHDSVELIRHNEISIKKLAQVGHITFQQQRPEHAASAVVQRIEMFVPLEGLIDMDVEKRRLEKEISRVEAQLVSLNNKLVNRDFLARAPGDVIEKNVRKSRILKRS